SPSVVLAQASPYVPLDDVAFMYIDALMARGELRQLASNERPYTVTAVRQALAGSRKRIETGPLRSYAEGLERSLVKTTVEGSRRSDRADRRQPGPDAFGARLSGAFYAFGQTSGRRELMLADDVNSVDPGIMGRLVLAGGPVVGMLRVIGDTRLNDDPEFAGRKDRDIGGRTEDGYVSGQWRYGELFLGRASRNWGPSVMPGLVIGNYAYSYDHLYGRFGTPRIHFASLFAKLDSDPLGGGRVSNRYLAAHRLAGRIGRVEIGINESILMSGEGRGLEIGMLNPLNIYALSWRNENLDGNLMVGADAALRTRRFGNWSAELLIDDLQIDRCDAVCEEPSSYGFTFAAEGLPLRGAQRWFASYTRVSSLAYRTPLYSERYTSFDVGLGRGFSDYDETRVGLDLALVPRIPLRVYAAHRRQGAGDYRAAFPDTSAYRTTPAFLIPNTATVQRLGLSGGGVLGRGFELTADLGLNRVRHTMAPGGAGTRPVWFDSSEDRSGFEGRVRLGWEPGWTLFRAGRP
ncbi:MAG: hypothetical protein H0W42_10165, partial [Gemmatimonadaceae bacterium]|nr:hypothetical protein [Gemmatimonadaceae bacterium]